MITEKHYLEAKKIVNTYESKQFNKPDAIRKVCTIGGECKVRGENNECKVKYTCDLCGQNTFDAPSPHKCRGGFRKRGLTWSLNCHYVLQISEGTNSVGFSEGFGLLLMCC